VSNLAPPLQQAITEFSKLPGVGKKTAQRLVFHLLKAPRERSTSLAEAIVELVDKIRFCRDCFNLCDEDLCPICNDPTRDLKQLCIVEEPTNLFALERTGCFKGLYHVLGGALAPLKDIGPDQLRLRELMERIGQGGFEEIVVATNPDVEGEATAVYLSRLLKPMGLRVTRLAQGLPVGGDIEYSDDLTIRRALEGRREY
jgi:recombination protein RecR